MAALKMQQDQKEISVIITPHALERIKERLQMDGMSRDEIVKKFNKELSKGYIKDLEGQEGKYLLGFEGPNLYFILKKEGKTYFLLTVEWRLESNYPTKVVNIKYL
ncbi:MAG: hypothetical protein ACP5P2_03665 [Candidatus Micrarchaeia archaeon]|jgi:hypothetical protein